WRRKAIAVSTWGFICFDVMTKFTALCQFCFRKFVIERAVSYSEPSVYKFDFFCVFLMI
ncbi:unnamed protein product, partial [Prunus brigantina]